MPPPTNVSFATATDLGSLPADVTQDVHDAGTTYEVFYKFTAPVGARVIGAWGFGDLATYTPTLIPYDSAEAQILAISSLNKPIQFPVVGGSLYYLKFTPNGGNPTPASLRIRAEVAPHSDIATGNILVNDDTEGFPLAVISHLIDYQIIKFVNDMPSGEAGDILFTSGVFCLSNEHGNDEVKVFDPSFNLLATISYASGAIPRIRTCTGTQKFWLGLNGAAGAGLVRTINSAGVVGVTTWTLPSTNLGSLAANNDETILYNAANSIGAAIRRFDLITSLPLSDLAAAVAGYQCPDILYLSDDTILVLYFAFAGTRDTFVRRYDTSGAVLNTYNFGTAFQSFVPRLAYALDNPNSFWIFLHNDDETSSFQNIKCSDGSILADRSFAEYEMGIYEPAATTTPLARFGTSESCPFMVVPGEVEPGIFVIVPGLRNDLGETIPTPIFKTALMP